MLVFVIALGQQMKSRDFFEKPVNLSREVASIIDFSKLGLLLVMQQGYHLRQTRMVWCSWSL